MEKLAHRLVEAPSPKVVKAAVPYPSAADPVRLPMGALAKALPSCSATVVSARPQADAPPERSADCGLRDTASQFDLRGGQVLVVERRGGEDALRIVGADGRVTLSILVTERGPVLCFEGGLTILARGNLALEAEHLALHGREGLSVSSGGNVAIETPGDLACTARTQTLTASLGDLRMHANDDVRLNGERVMVNC
jgi:hypothetical protein